MKKIILVLSILLVITLSSCVSNDTLYEYSDFSNIAIKLNSEAEGKSTDKYIVYYYQETCSHCNDVKQDILGFADGFETLDFYIFDISKASDRSSLEEFIGTLLYLFFPELKLLKVI